MTLTIGGINNMLQSQKFYQASIEAIIEEASKFINGQNKSSELEYTAKRFHAFADDGACDGTDDRGDLEYAKIMNSLSSLFKAASILALDEEAGGLLEFSLNSNDKLDFVKILIRGMARINNILKRRIEVDKKTEALCGDNDMN